MLRTVLRFVPGITAASGVSSYAGIPLTHRDYAQSCLFVTGHLKDGTADLDWPSLVRLNQTVVIYMGLGGLPEISRQLVAHGASADLPVAVVQDGTISTQSRTSPEIGRPAYRGGGASNGNPKNSITALVRS